MLMKKITCTLLSFMMIVLCLTVPAFAESDIKLTDEVYPTEFIEGNTFSVYGVVTSSYKILAVTIGVYKTDGEVAFSYTGKPGTLTYDIHNIDYLMTFSRLEAGEYIYRIVATDTEESDVLLLEKEFKVVSKDEYETLRLNDANYPVDIQQGKTFSIYGTVTSDFPISSVTCSVRNINGTLMFTKTANPGTTSYSLSNIDRYMTFSKLTAGTYVYKVVASDQYNSGVVLLEKQFTVTAPTMPDNEYGDINWDVIDISVWNEIVSWDEISENVDGVIARIGSRTTVSKAVSTDKKFLDHYENAKKQGLPVGCYFFSAALTVNEAIEEANHVLKVLRENNCVLEMPVYFDMETEDQVALTQKQATAIARAFCEKIEEGGYYTGIYCNKFFARDELYADQLTDYHFWIAQYASSCTYYGPYGMWQYSETGSVPGIRGNVDMNYCYYDYPQIIKNLGMSGNKIEKPVVTPPSYSFKDVDGFKIDISRKIVSGVKPTISSDTFTNTYLTLKDGATVKYTNTVSNLVATGTKVVIMGGDDKLAEFTVSVRGDTDMNSKVNSSDALTVLQYAVGSRDLGPARKLSADMNGDEQINSSDALAILQFAVGK